MSRIEGSTQCFAHSKLLAQKKFELITKIIWRCSQKASIAISFEMPRHKEQYDDEYDDNPRDREIEPREPEKRRTESISVRVPPQDHGLLIGRAGATIRDLEYETRCTFDIPRRESGSNEIWITGDVDDLAYAKERVLEITSCGKGRRQTHEQEPAPARPAVPSTKNAFPSLPGERDVVLLVDVEKWAHARVIGQGHTRIDELRKRLCHKEGLPDVCQNQGVEVIVPDRADTSSLISVHVPESIAPRAEKVIREFFNFYEITQHLRGITVVKDAASMGTSIPATKPSNTHVDTQKKPALESGSSKISVNEPPPAEGKATDGARKPRAPVGENVDNLAIGYTHPELPKRQFL